MIKITHHSYELSRRGPSEGREGWRVSNQAPPRQQSPSCRRLNHAKAQERSRLGRCLQPRRQLPYTERRLLWSYFKGLLFERPVGVRPLSVLSELNVGASGVLVSLDLPESVQNHLMHMGFVPNALVTVLRRAPAGDPTLYGIDGMEIALRRETAAAIQMRAVEAESEADSELIEAAR